MTEFNDLSIAEPILKSLKELGYETPTPIQLETIPVLLKGRDLMGQAHTGTGKTAAFAIPALTRLNLNKRNIQVLVLTPTRELAIQVSEAINKYAMHMKGIRIMPIYGGQEFGIQYRQLRAEPHVVVGTPGRIMDHLRRRSLDLSQLEFLVLDEADEMLQMGFLEDVEWILDQTPKTQQTALFSATLPEPIRRIAKKYLKNPAEITIKRQTSTVSKTRQRYWEVSPHHKLDALTRILEGESFDGVLIFVRTKIETVKLTESINARGYGAVALNGDVPQNMRERTIHSFKEGKFNILIATDVAARGLDVPRISHVINYDIPYDPQIYIHRIGRTGRANRSGEAILFVSPRERRLLKTIESSTKQKIELLKLPSTEVINDKRVAKFMQRISDTLATESHAEYSPIIEKFANEHNISVLDIASALAKMLRGKHPLLLSNQMEKETFNDHKEHPAFEPKNKEGMNSFRVEMGAMQGLKKKNLLNAIAIGAKIDRNKVGRIEIFNKFSTVTLPPNLPEEKIRSLRNLRIFDRDVKIFKSIDHRTQKRNFYRHGERKNH